MKGGKLVHCAVSPQQAAILRLAIANYRKAKKLMKAWEDEPNGLWTSKRHTNPNS
jgi:hypothetical protein